MATPKNPENAGCGDSRRINRHTRTSAAAASADTIAATLGVVMPSVIVLILLLKFVLYIKDNPKVKSMLKGLRPVVVAMLAYAAWDMAPNALKGHMTIVIAAVSLALMIFTPIHPALIIVAGALIGVALKL